MGISDYGESIHDAEDRQKEAEKRRRTWFPGLLGHWTWRSVIKHFPEDQVLLDCGMTYYPNEAGDGLLPMVVIYIQINGTEKIDGLYMTQVLAPSLASAETVDAIVERLAMQSQERRGQIRNALRAGELPGELGVPVPPSP